MAETFEPPTPLARRLVRYLVGFGVGVALGSAPWLGTLQVPGFTALLDLFPYGLQARFVALAPFLMGVLAVAVQFYGERRLSQARLRRLFRWTLLTLGITFVVLVIVYTLVVVDVPYRGGDRTARFVVGFERLETCPCPVEWSDAQCLQERLDPARVEACWSRITVRLFELFLTLAYLGLIGGFGALVGLLLLTEQRRRRARKTET